MITKPRLSKDTADDAAPLEGKIKGMGGGCRPKIQISFILMYVIALSFFFPKWGNTLLKYRSF